MAALKWSQGILKQLDAQNAPTTEDPNAEQPFVFAEGTDDKDPADLYTEQALALASPIFSQWLDTLEDHLFTGAEDLSEVRDRLDSAFSELDSKDFASLMQDVMLAGYGAGRYQVQEESTDDAEVAETLEFATKKSKNSRTCRKGFPCGNSCISRTKMCNKRLEGQYKTAAEWLESKLPPAPNKKSPQTHTEFIELGNSVMGEVKAQIDALLKGDPIEQERIKNEYMAAQKELMNALDNYKMRVKDREAVRAKHKAAEEAYLDYEKNKRSQAAIKMEEFRLQLIAEGGASKADAENFLRRIQFFESQIEDALNSDFTRRDLDDSLKEFVQLTRLKSTSSLNTITAQSFRASASRNGTIDIGTPSKRAIFHEMGHHVEFESEIIQKSAKDWIKSRATSDRPELISKLTGNSNYSDDEIAYPDKFINPYVGKVYPDATEVVSMGIEHFTSGRMMLELYQNDKEHFAFTVGVIKS